MTLLDQPAPGTNRLSRARLQNIEAAFRASANQRIASIRAGIADRTWRRWETQGWEDLKAYLDTHGIDPDDVDYEELLQTVPFDELPHVHFVLTIQKARVDFVLHNLGAISLEAVGTTVEETHTTVTEKVLIEGGADDDGKMIPRVVERQTVTRTVRKPRKSWQAAAWLLERTFPDEYARTIRQEISGRGGEPIEVDVQELARQRIREKLHMMRSNADEAARIIDADSHEVTPELGP